MVHIGQVLQIYSIHDTVIQCGLFFNSVADFYIS